MFCHFAQRIGLDQKPISQAGLKDYLANRFRCAPCDADFCRSCHVHPYHIGFTCAEFAEFQIAPKCRFCSAAVLARNRHPNLPPAFAATTTCCNAKECVDKLALCCARPTQCGHFCCGVAGEAAAHCPPCLRAECQEAGVGGASASVSMHQSLDDECAICYTEELGQAPCVMLACGGPGGGARHVFHADCLKTRLEKGWAGASIDFSFLKCPLCDARVTAAAAHPLLKPVLARHLELERRVGDMAVARLAFEGMEGDPAIALPGGRFFRDPRAFAMHHFSFFQCFECQAPYFAGAHACAPAVDGDEVNRRDLVCGNCQSVQSQESCAKHGNDWLSFKCRFCCANAVWHCWVCFAATCNRLARGVFTR